MIKLKKIIILAVVFAMTFSICYTPVSATSTTSESTDATATPEADTSYDKYISFGADLTTSEKSKVLSLIGVSEDELSEYKTIEVTNTEEHDYLDKYISSSVIGTHALSSVKIIKTTDGSGINVVTRNISYCTSAMYQNALITAGLTNADVTVAGPFSISGTSALVGTMKAYAAMTGEDISKSTMDAATDELVTTAEIAKSYGDSEKITQLVAAAKQKIFEDQLSSEDDIRNAITTSASSLGIDLTDDQINELTDMMMKVSKTDVDIDALKEQAQNIYNDLKNSGIDLGNVDTSGLAESVGGFFANIFNAISDFFGNLFN